MTRRARIILLLGLLGAAVLAAAVTPPVRQDPAYHLMADTRAMWGVANALNVVSNLPFVLVGVLGLATMWRGGIRFLDERERWPYFVFFAGLFLTGLGSAYYHLETTNERLLWDRLPLSATFMGLFTAIIAERIGVRAGVVLLAPLVVLGAMSVLIWYAGERRGEGDLRLYGLVQFFPILIIPLIVLLFPSRYTRGGDLLAVAGLYGLGKLFELLDGPVFSLGSVVSGHTLKHLAAVLSGYLVWQMLIRRRPA